MSSLVSASHDGVLVKLSLSDAYSEDSLRIRDFTSIDLRGLRPPLRRWLEALEARGVDSRSERSWPAFELNSPTMAKCCRQAAAPERQEAG